MWAILHGIRKLRHMWGGGGNGGKIMSLCGLEGYLPLEYARGAKLKKCQRCQEEVGRKEKKTQTEGV